MYINRNIYEFAGKMTEMTLALNNDHKVKILKLMHRINTSCLEYEI